MEVCSATMQLGGGWAMRVYCLLVVSEEPYGVVRVVLGGHRAKSKKPQTIELCLTSSSRNQKYCKLWLTMARTSTDTVIATEQALLLGAEAIKQCALKWATREAGSGKMLLGNKFVPVFFYDPWRTVNCFLSPCTVTEFKANFDFYQYPEKKSVWFIHI